MLINVYLVITKLFEMNYAENSDIAESDNTFDAALSKSTQGHSYIHWTPIEVIKTAVDWLGTASSNRILDIGSGVGKFCIIGSMNSRAHFTGVEIRDNLFEESIRLKSELQLSNVEFIHSDIQSIDFNNFTSFYFYNPFCELVALSGRIDEQFQLDEEKYSYYQDFVVSQLKNAPKGTKLVTYCSPDLDISMDFDLIDMYFEGLLQLWIKR